MEVKNSKEVKVEDNKGLTVGKLKKFLEGHDVEKNVVFISGSGSQYEFNTNASENPKTTKTNDGTSEHVVIFIK